MVASFNYHSASEVIAPDSDENGLCPTPTKRITHDVYKSWPTLYMHAYMYTAGLSGHYRWITSSVLAINKEVLDQALRNIVEYIWYDADNNS